jgi:hypothetical protein
MKSLARIGIVALLVVGLLAGGAEAKKKRRSSGGAACTVRVVSKSVAVGIGWTWGSGSLRCGSRTYPFKIDGLTVNAVGASRSDATGYVYDLKNVRDFEGTYAAVEAAGTLGGGKGITTLKNENGVRMTLHSTREGIEAKASPEGVKVTFQ